MKFFLPSVFLVLIVLLDRLASQLVGDQTFAPFLAVFSFFIMANFLPPRWILGWLPFFTAASYWLIVDTSQFPKTRTVTVALAGLLASSAAHFREKASRQAREIELVLKSLPTPWVLLSGEGSILRSNSLGAGLLGSTPEEIAGHSIFEFSCQEEDRRRLIEAFVKVAKTGTGNGEMDFAWGRMGAGGKTVTSRVIFLPSLKDRPLLMVLREG